MNAVIFGGGKIARGFIAQLLSRSGYHITFVEISEVLVRALNEKGTYYVNVMGNPKESQWIRGFTCIQLSDIPGIAEALKNADIVFTSVGGKNLDGLAEIIAEAYGSLEEEDWEREFTIVTCENWKEPADQLKNGILEVLGDSRAGEAFRARVGVSEAVIMRSGVEAAEEVRQIDENAVSVTDFWELPIDKDRMKGKLPAFEGVNYKENFTGFLQQKLFTFNTTNAAIAYLGRLRGIELLSKAANDPEIVELVEQIHQEINPAIAREMGIELKAQEAFAEKALKKYQDLSVTDFTERHGRDPIRKLGPSDRIVGTIRLAEKQGILCKGLAAVLAAALYYPADNPADPTAQILEEMRKSQGIDRVLEEICKIKPGEQLAVQVKKQIVFLREKGWLDG